MIKQLFSDNLTSLLAPSAEAITDGITTEATTEQFTAAVNHIFADTPIDTTMGNFSDARRSVGDLFRNRLNYRPTIADQHLRAENETRDDVVIQFLTLIFISRHLHKNTELRLGIKREIFMNAFLFHIVRNTMGKRLIFLMRLGHYFQKLQMDPKFPRLL